VGESRWKNASAEYREREGTRAVEWARKRRKEIREVIHRNKSERGFKCLDCRTVYPAVVLDFDHRADEQKLFAISNAVQSGGLKLARLQAEIDKCDLVCANCHRIRHYGATSE
jgi:hypothetical protein